MYKNYKRSVEKLSKFLMKFSILLVLKFRQRTAKISKRGFRKSIQSLASGFRSVKR